MYKLLKEIKRKCRYLRDRGYELHLCIKEFRANSRTNDVANESEVKNGMLLAVHRIEKGLGLENCTPGHSADVAFELLRRMQAYIEAGYNINEYAFRESVAVLNTYIKYQRDYGDPAWKPLKKLVQDFKNIQEQIGDELFQSIVDTMNAGANKIPLQTLETGIDFDFESFISSRHSMRMYRNEEINTADMKRVIELANKAPSACNRQPVRVYFANNPEKVTQIDDLITGSLGFKGKTPNYCLVTVDRAQFKRDEQFQWYINGGIYLSFLVLAMHSLGIGSCIMQWKAFHTNESKLKKLACISENEAIVAIVGCGYYSNNTTCICAERKGVEDTLKFI